MIYEDEYLSGDDIPAGIILEFELNGTDYQNAEELELPVQHLLTKSHRFFIIKH